MVKTGIRGLEYRKKLLTFDGVPLQEIARELGTPVYVYSAKTVTQNFEALQNSLGKTALVCFAVKSNSNLAILNLLGSLGAGADIVSGGEFFRARKAGISAKKIVFSGVGKTRQEMKDALHEEIFSFNVESIAELKVLQEVAHSERRIARVALRFNPDVDPKTHPYISTGLKKNKFGLTRKEILQAIPGLLRMKNVVLKGISIHIGSQLSELGPFEDAFSKLKNLMSELETVVGPLEFVDLGGGLGVPYLADQKVPLISDYCALVQKFFGVHSGLKVLLEPGRSISANAGVLLTEVLFRKSKPSKDFLIVDAGMNDLMRPALYQSIHRMIPLREKPIVSTVRTDVVGPVCESSDCFLSDAELDAKLGAGDLLAILSSGAYGFSMASTYNSRPRPPEVLIHEGQFRVIRRRETYSDLIRGETLC